MLESKLQKTLARIAKQSLQPLPSQFVNEIMRNGDKKTAQGIIQDCFDVLLTNGRRVNDFDVAIQKISPVVKTSSKKRGGKNILIPKPLDKRQQSKIGINWILEQSSKSQKKGSMGEKIGTEMLAILNDSSSLISKRAQVHKMAVQNRSNIVLKERRK